MGTYAFRLTKNGSRTHTLRTKGGSSSSETFLRHHLVIPLEVSYPQEKNIVSAESITAIGFLIGRSATPKIW